MTWEYRAVQPQARARGNVGEHPIGERLRKLGAEGWELAGVALLEDPLFSLYVFKRPHGVGVQEDGVRMAAH